MSVKALKTINLGPDDVVDSRHVQFIQDNIGEVARAVSNSPIVDGKLLTGVSLVSGVDNVVKHLLGRPILGRFIVRCSQAAVISDSASANGQPNSLMILRSTVTTTASIWVF